MVNISVNKNRHLNNYKEKFSALKIFDHPDRTIAVYASLSYNKTNKNKLIDLMYLISVSCIQFHPYNPE